MYRYYCILSTMLCFFFFFNDTATTEIYTLSLHDALPIYTDSKYRAGDNEYDINIRFDQAGRGTIDDVKNLKFINPQGQTVTLEQFADISYGSGPTLLERRDKSPSVSVQAQVVGKPAGTLADEWEAE